MNHAQKIAAACVGIVFVAAGTTGAIVQEATEPSQHAAPLTGTIDRTYSKGQCQAGTKCWDCRGPVDLDRVTINVDSTVDANGKAIDAVHFVPGCTGRIGEEDDHG